MCESLYLVSSVLTTFSRRYLGIPGFLIPEPAGGSLDTPEALCCEMDCILDSNGIWCPSIGQWKPED